MKHAVLAALFCLPLLAQAEGAAHAPSIKGDAAAGATKAAVCTACHGPGGASANPEWPKLAGQSPRYMVEQLKAFKSGARKNVLMSAQGAALSDQDMADLAAHYAAQKPSYGVASKDSIAIAEKLYRAGDAARGLPACSACHGPAGAGNAAAGYARLGGQHATYNTAALNRLRAAAAEPLADGNVKIMASIASKLTDQEIAALASYVSGLQ